MPFIHVQIKILVRWPIEVAKILVSKSKITFNMRTLKWSSRNVSFIHWGTTNRPVLNQELTLSSNTYFFQIPSRLFSLESANTVRCILNQEILVIIQKLVFYVFHQKHMNLSQNGVFDEVSRSKI